MSRTLQKLTGLLCKQKSSNLLFLYAVCYNTTKLYDIEKIFFCHYFIVEQKMLLLLQKTISKFKPIFEHDRKKLIGLILGFLMNLYNSNQKTDKALIFYIRIKNSEINCVNLWTNDQPYQLSSLSICFDDQTCQRSINTTDQYTISELISKNVDLSSSYNLVSHVYDFTNLNEINLQTTLTEQQNVKTKDFPKIMERAGFVKLSPNPNSQKSIFDQPSEIFIQNLSNQYKNWLGNDPEKLFNHISFFFLGYFGIIGENVADFYLQPNLSFDTLFISNKKPNLQKNDEILVLKITQKSTTEDSQICLPNSLKLGAKFAHFLSYELNSEKSIIGLTNKIDILNISCAQNYTGMIISTLDTFLNYNYTVNNAVGLFLRHSMEMYLGIILQSLCSFVEMNTLSWRWYMKGLFLSIPEIYKNETTVTKFSSECNFQTSSSSGKRIINTMSSFGLVLGYSKRVATFIISQSDNQTNFKLSENQVNYTRCENLMVGLAQQFTTLNTENTILHASLTQNDSSENSHVKSVKFQELKPQVQQQMIDFSGHTIQNTNLFSMSKNSYRPTNLFYSMCQTDIDKSLNDFLQNLNDAQTPKSIHEMKSLIFGYLELIASISNVQFNDYRIISIESKVDSIDCKILIDFVNSNATNIETKLDSFYENIHQKFSTFENTLKLKGRNFAVFSEVNFNSDQLIKINSVSLELNRTNEQLAMRCLAWNTLKIVKPIGQCRFHKNHVYFETLHYNDSKFQTNPIMIINASSIIVNQNLLFAEPKTNPKNDNLTTFFDRLPNMNFHTTKKNRMRLKGSFLMDESLFFTNLKKHSVIYSHKHKYKQNEYTLVNVDVNLKKADFFSHSSFDKNLSFITWMLNNENQAKVANNSTMFFHDLSNPENETLKFTKITHEAYSYAEFTYSNSILTMKSIDAQKSESFDSSKIHQIIKENYGNDRSSVRIIKKIFLNGCSLDFGAENEHFFDISITDNSNYHFSIKKYIRSHDFGDQETFVKKEFGIGECQKRFFINVHPNMRNFENNATNGKYFYVFENSSLHFLNVLKLGPSSTHTLIINASFEELVELKPKCVDKDVIEFTLKFKNGGKYIVEKQFEQYNPVKLHLLNNVEIFLDDSMFIKLSKSNDSKRKLIELAKKFQCTILAMPGFEFETPKDHLSSDYLVSFTRIPNFLIVTQNQPKNEFNLYVATHAAVLTVQSYCQSEEATETKCTFKDITISFQENERIFEKLVINLDKLKDSLGNILQTSYIQIFDANRGNILIMVYALDIESPRNYLIGTIRLQKFPEAMANNIIILHDYQSMFITLDRKTGKYIPPKLSNVPISIPSFIDTLILTPKYSKIQLEMMIYKEKSSVTFIRMKNHLLIRNNDLNDSDGFSKNRINLLFLNFFLAKSSFVHVTIGFLQYKKILLRKDMF